MQLCYEKMYLASTVPDCSGEKKKKPNPYSSKPEHLNLFFSRHSQVGDGDSSLEQSFGDSTDAAATISAPLRALAAAACPGSSRGVSQRKQVGFSPDPFPDHVHHIIACMLVLS